MGCQEKSLNGMKILASKGDNEDFAPIYHVNKKSAKARWFS